MSLKIQLFSNRIADFSNLWPSTTGFFFGLQLHIPSAAIAVAEGEKPSATAVDLWPLVDHWWYVLVRTAAWGQVGECCLKLTQYSLTSPHFFLIQLSDLFCQLMILYGTVAYLLYVVFTVTEMVVMKALYILRFSRIAAMNENFITLNLILFSGMLISWNIIMRLTLREYEVNPWLYLYFDYNPINRFLESENRPLLLIM